MVCTIHGKHSHFRIGLSQSIHCAMMQLTRAVGHRHMCPMPTNTRQFNLSIERYVLYPVCPVKKRWLSCQRNQPFEEDFSCHLGWLSVTLDALVPSKAPFSNPPKLCRTLLTTGHSSAASNVKLHFGFFCTAYFNGSWRGSVAKLCSRQKCNCGRLCTTVWVFVGVEHELGTPVLRLPLIAPLRHSHQGMYRTQHHSRQ